MQSRLAAVALSIVVLATAPLAAQTTGNIAGKVSDPTGAAIVGAEITVANPAKLVDRHTRSDSSGAYSFPVLPPGTYTLTVRSAGFRTTVVPNATVTITETVAVDVKLAVGAAAESITVRAAAPFMQSNGPQLGRVLSGDAVEKLPLATRNFSQALALQPGTSAVLPDATGVGRNTQGISVNGARVTENNFRLNGVDANTLGTNGPVLVPVPAPETIEEFKVQTAMYDSSYGRAGGANVQVLTRSGGDRFHGSGYEYFGNEALNANDGFLKSARVPRPVLRRNMFGGTLGGPVVPGQAFFFVSYQGTRERNGASLSNSISSRVLVAPGLTDDRSAATLAATFNPPGPIDPHALALLNERLPDGSFVIPTPQPDGTYTGSTPSRFQEDQFNANFDWRRHERDLFTVKSFFANTSQHLTLPSFRGSGPNVPGFGSNGEFNNRTIAVQEIHTFSPQSINEARLGYTLNRNNTSPDEPLTGADIGVARSTAEAYPGLPLIRIAPNAGGVIVGTAPAIEGSAAAWTWTVSDMVTLARGKHTLRAGGESRLNGINYRIPNFARGQIDFASFTDFLLGRVQSSTLGSGLVGRAWRARDFDVFVQDDWKVGPRLTVNLGLRYELALAIHDTMGRLSTFDPALYVPRMQTNLGVPVGPPVGGFVQAGNVGAGLDLASVPNVRDDVVYGSDRNNFAPRVGFAWSPLLAGRLVLRGGFGLFYSRPTFQYASLTDRTPPFYVLAVAQAKTFGDPFFALPAASQFPTFVPGVLLAGSVFDRNLQTPMFQQFDLGAQYGLSRDLLLEVSYVGSRGAHLFRQVAINQAQLALPGNPVQNPVVGPVASNTQSNAPLRAPLQGVSINSFSQNQSSGHSSYDSLQISATQRLWHGVQFQLAYTWSKSIDDASGAGQGAGASGLVNTSTVGDTSGSLGNQRLAGFNRGLSDFDRTHRFVASYTWAVPGRGGRRLRRAALQGWQVSGIATVMSGAPIDVVDSAAGSLYGLDKGSSPLARPRLLAGMTCGHAMENLASGYQFNGTVFADPVVLAGQPIPSSGGQALAASKGTDIGDVGRNCLRGPSQANVDVAMAKSFHVREAATLQLRAAFLNALNHHNLANPVSNLNAVSASGGSLDPNTGAVLAPGNLGRIISSSNNPRIIQFSLAFQF